MAKGDKNGGVWFCGLLAVVFITLTAGCRAGISPVSGAEDSGAGDRAALMRRIEALESCNRVLALDLAFMSARNEEAMRMAEGLLVRTRLSYPMANAEIINELADYQSGLCALLEK
jgi:hypothetical protein